MSGLFVVRALYTNAVLNVHDHENHGFYGIMYS